jgi:hypothetical protein
MRNSLRLIVVVAMAAMAAAGLTYCGGGGGGDSKETCPGITCNNCSGSGNCNLSCSPGKTQVCTAHPDNSSLRCAYCR